MYSMAELFGVDGGVVVDGLAEEGEHPLVDRVFAVVALPVADACAGDGGFEAGGLGDAEHGHEAAVAPAGEAFAVPVDGESLFEGVHSGEDVAEIAVAEVLDVGLGEFFALAVAAAGVGQEDEVAEGGEGDAAVSEAGPVRGYGGGWASMDAYDQRILFGGS